MKMSAEKIAECEAWVEKNGLYPQRCGAPVKAFCEAMGIDYTTHERWLSNAEYADALSRAREKFSATIVRDVENALVRAARGVDYTKKREEARAQKIVEYDPQTGKKIRETTGPLQTVKAYKETVFFPPDVRAAQFVLTNMAPEQWKVRQEIGGTLDVRQIVVENDDQRRKLEELGRQGI